MAWWPFATKPEKVETSEVTGLNNYAPPLYSAVNTVVRKSIPVAAQDVVYTGVKCIAH
jgi:hypothetical protein